MNECAGQAYAMWEEGVIPFIGEDLSGGPTVGYGNQLLNGNWEFPLMPPHRYLDDNLSRNLVKLPTGYTLKPCPFCGHQPLEDNLIDSIHPLNREHTLWTAGCVDNEGGCNASSLGDTMLDAVNKWNTRAHRK